MTAPRYIANTMLQLQRRTILRYVQINNYFTTLEAITSTVLRRLQDNIWCSSVKNCQFSRNSFFIYKPAVFNLKPIWFWNNEQRIKLVSLWKYNCKWTKKLAWLIPTSSFASESINYLVYKSDKCCHRFVFENT